MSTTHDDSEIDCTEITVHATLVIYREPDETVTEAVRRYMLDTDVSTAFEIELDPCHLHNPHDRNETGYDIRGRDSQTPIGVIDWETGGVRITWTSDGQVDISTTADETCAQIASRGISIDADDMLKVEAMHHLACEHVRRTTTLGNCISVCSSCGAGVHVPREAGEPPFIVHEHDCPRSSWTVHEAIEYVDGTKATIDNWEAS